LNNFVYVDGGLYYNYPINIFDNKKYVSEENSLPAPYDCRPGAVYNKETLGLRVDTKDEIKSHLKKIEEPPKKIKSLKDYAMVFIGGLTDNLNKMHLHKNDWHRTIHIDALGVGATDFDLEDKTIQELIQSGRDGVKNYFRWFDNPAEDEEQPINK
jgi:NTE family protein